MHNHEYFFLYFHEFSLQTISYEVAQVVIFSLSVYRNASQNEDFYYNGYFLAARNQTRDRETIPVIPCMMLAELKISLYRTIQQCLIPTRYTRTCCLVLAITFSLNQTGTVLVQVQQVKPRTEVTIPTSAVAEALSSLSSRKKLLDCYIYGRLSNN